MLLGKILANSGMAKGFNVTWLPSYGAEVRGGTAYSMVKISSGNIASPVIDKTDTAIIMNAPSLDKFEKRIKKSGMLILNTSLVKERHLRKDIDIVGVPLTEEAVKLGNVRVANTIAIGIYAAKRGIIDKITLKSVIEEMGAGKEDLIALNLKAMEAGFALASVI